MTQVMIQARSATVIGEEGGVGGGGVGDENAMVSAVEGSRVRLESLW